MFMTPVYRQRNETIMKQYLLLDFLFYTLEKKNFNGKNVVHTEQEHAFNDVKIPLYYNC